MLSGASCPLCRRGADRLSSPRQWLLPNGQIWQGRPRTHTRPAGVVAHKFFLGCFSRLTGQIRTHPNPTQLMTRSVGAHIAACRADPLPEMKRSSTIFRWYPPQPNPSHQFDTENSDWCSASGRFSPCIADRPLETTGYRWHSPYQRPICAFRPVSPRYSDLTIRLAAFANDAHLPKSRPKID